MKDVNLFYLLIEIQRTRSNSLKYILSSLPSTFGNFEPYIDIFHVLQDSSDFKALGIHDDNDLIEGLNMDDVPLTIKNGEIFGCPQGTTRYQFEDGGMECQSMEKNMSVTESNGPIESALEVTSFN